jgi:hypothetical protein
MEVRLEYLLKLTLPYIKTRQPKIAFSLYTQPLVYALVSFLERVSVNKR